MYVCKYNYMYRCKYVCTHIYTIKCRLPESVLYLGTCAGLTTPPGMLAQLLRVAQSGPESQSFPWRVQQTLVTSVVTFSHLQLWPQDSEPVSQPSSWLLGRPFIYLCFNENKLGFSHSPR